MMPHFGHTKPIAVVMTDRVKMYSRHLSKHKDKNAKSINAWSVRESVYDVSFGLTFAGLDTLIPPVIRVSVADTSTVFVPSTARSATTDSAGFFERATSRALHYVGRGNG